MNNITIKGTVGRVEDGFVTQSGKLLAKFSVADNGKRNHTRWFTVEAWNADAELVLTSLAKGVNVEIEGYFDRAEAYIDKAGKPQAKPIVALHKFRIVEKTAAA